MKLKIALIKLLKSRIFHAVLLAVAAYLIFAPLYPEVEFQVRDKLNIRYKSLDFIESEDGDYDVDLDGNFLIIPQIGVNINIVEGQNESVLSQGAWRRPNSSTPDKGGNTVITGHRFHYIPPNNKTFYNLDKLQEGSKIFVYWKGERYIYTVYDVFLVKPERLDIEGPREGNILTLYTCHPLWTADKRLVILSVLDKDSS
jgi:sortase A